MDDLATSPRRENREGSSDGQRMAVEELREGSSLHTVPCAAQGEVGGMTSGTQVYGSNLAKLH